MGGVELVLQEDAKFECWLGGFMYRVVFMKVSIKKRKARCVIQFCESLEIGWLG